MTLILAVMKGQKVR